MFKSHGYFKSSKLKQLGQGKKNYAPQESSLIFFSTRMLGHTLNLVWQQWWGWKLHIPISNSLVYRLPLQVGSPKRKKKTPIMELIEKVMKKSTNERKPQLLLNKIFFFFWVKFQILLSKIFKIVDENFGLLITL